MCGIVGIYAYGATAGRVDGEELQCIRDHMAVRGPDGVGAWYSGDKRIGFGHRRLAIIDLSDRAAQPMQSSDGRFVVTFNGEIYNHQALRAELEAKGYVFRTKSDTEVLLHLYADKGKGMVDCLRGMFAFGLWDNDKNELLLARDPYGIKPLYYSDDGQCVRFASQVKALVAGGRTSSAIDPAGLVGFCIFGSVPEPFTIHKEVRALPAGCILRVSERGREEPEAYFDIGEIFADAMGGPTKSVIEASESLVKEALRDSVQHHLVADVPVGVFLSGGIDSGAVVGIAAQLLGQDSRPLRTVSVAFEEFRGQSDDETPLAAEVARLYGTDHSVRTVRRSEFESDLPRIFAAMDQPTIDGINVWFASKGARERGLKVAMSGLGGDELLGGYPSFKDIPLWVRALQIPSALPGLGRFFRSAYTGITRFARSTPKAASLLEYGGTYPGAYLLRRGLFMPWELTQLLGTEVVEEGLARLDPLSHIARSMSSAPNHPFGRVATLEASVYMRNQLLRDVDWASMAHSLEVRVPLVDRALLRALAPLLITSDRAPGKAWLAGAPRPKLPEAVLRKPKTGFNTPINEWLLHGQAVQEASGNRLPAQTHWSRRWALSVLSHFASGGEIRAAA